MGGGEYDPNEGKERIDLFDNQNIFKKPYNPQKHDMKFLNVLEGVSKLQFWNSNETNIP
jgi:hypothetical protein